METTHRSNRFSKFNNQTFSLLIGQIKFRCLFLLSVSVSSYACQMFELLKPLVLRIVRIGDFYDTPTSGILTTSGNTSFQKFQTVGDFYDVIGRIGIISTLKVLSQTSQTSAIFTMSVNQTVLRIAIVVRIPVSGNGKNPRFLRSLGQVGTRLKR